jgi:hypothetical protein
MNRTEPNTSSYPIANLPGFVVVSGERARKIKLGSVPVGSRAFKARNYSLFKGQRSVNQIIVWFSRHDPVCKHESLILQHDSHSTRISPVLRL